MVHERLAPLQNALDLVERWRLELGGEEFSDGLNQSSIVLVGLVQDFPIDDLQAFAEAGNWASLEIRRAAWTARLVLQRGGRLVIDEVIGPVDEAFPDQVSIDEAQAARDEGRAADLLRLSAELEARVHVYLENSPSETGFHWIRTGEALLSQVRRHTWLGLVTALYSPGVPHRLVVHDAGGSSMSGRDLIVHGPDIFPMDSRERGSDGSREYADTWLQNGRAALPTPVAVLPSKIDRLDELADVFAGFAHGLCWLWLATSAQVTGASVTVRFEGAPDLDFDLTQAPAPSFAADAVRLWEWSVSTTDPARREALQQAVSLVVREAAALERSSERVLRTAKYLLRLAQHGAVAEVLAVRRSARQAAMATAQASAEASRTASRSVVDRVLTQLIGAFGILLANRADLINATVAGWLLLAILGLTVGTGIVAFAFELPAARGALGAFEEDLDGYSDMLLEDDIREIKRMKSLRQAGDNVTRARWVSGLLVVLAAGAVLAARLQV